MLRRQLFCIAVVGGLVACSGGEGVKPASLGRPAALADLSGIWHMVAETPSGVHEATMFVEQADRSLSGRFEGALGVMHFTGTVNTPDIQFSHQAMAGSMRFDYRGTIESNAMHGTAVFGTLGTGSWKATRVANQ